MPKKVDPMMSTNQSLLVVDDDTHISEFISAVASGRKIPCLVSSCAADFFEQLSPTITVVMIDLVMPEVDGVELLRLLSRRVKPPKVILMSGLGDRVIETAENLAKAMGLDVIGHLRKPFRLVELEEALANCSAQRTLRPLENKFKPSISDEEIFTAVAEDEFLVHYQPQIELSTGRVVSVEALARWQHPKYGLLYPDLFIERIEALGLMHQLTWNVARRAIADMRLLRSVDSEGLKLSLNVSVSSLQDLEFPDRFAALAKDHGLSMEDIILEVTESGQVQNLPETLYVLTRLRMRNIGLSIDDFGTGYSMLQQLQTIPATELKIDKAFVQNSQSVKSDRVMVTKIIEIGHELGIRVVAEGIETSEQLDFLKESGCDVVQGYYFSRPLSASSLVGWLHDYESQPSRAEAESFQVVV